MLTSGGAASGRRSLIIDVQSARQHNQEHRSAHPAAPRAPAAGNPEESEGSPGTALASGTQRWTRPLAAGGPICVGKEAREATRGGTLRADGEARGRRDPPGRHARLLTDPSEPEPSRGGAGGGACAGAGVKAVGPDRSVAPGELPPARQLAGTGFSPVRTTRRGRCRAPRGDVLWAVFLRTQHLPSLSFPHLQRRWADRSPSGARWPFPPAQGAGLADAAGEGFRAPGAAQGRGRLVGPRPNGKTFLCRGGGCPVAPGLGFTVSVPVGLQARSWGFRR